MAKRKRKTSGGGAFGKAGARRVPPAQDGEDDDPPEIMRARSGAQHERYLATMIRCLHGLIGTPEQGQDAFSAEISGLQVEDFLQRHDPEPAPHFRAMAHLEAREEGDSEESIRVRIEEALAIDPDCVDAHLLLAHLAPGLEKRLPHIRDAVAAGARKHEALDPRDPAFETLDLPYRDALHDLADYLDYLGDREEATRVYEELLDLDPDDPRDVHSALIANALVEEESDKARALLDQAPLQQSCSVLYGRAWLAVSEALKESPDFEPDMESYHPFAALNSPKANEARKWLRQAWEACPWAVPFVLDPRIVMLRPVTMYAVGDPYDALEFARLNYENWTLIGLPALWMVTEIGGGEGMTPPVVRRLRRFHGEFLDAVALYDDLEAPDWEGEEMAQALKQFYSISKELIEAMIAAGESPKGRRFRR